MKAHAIALTALFAVAFVGSADAAEIKKGDKLQTLSNLHPDMAKRLLYTVNYQLVGAMIPVCTEVTVKAINGKRMVFDYQGVEYMMDYEKNTKKGGISFQDALQAYFGTACDKAKMNKLGKMDQEGIKTGQPLVGMTKDGVLFALGRPPHHANPTTEANYWLYWRNRFMKLGVQFDDKGKVVEIR